jgi:type VI secretion system secreted protein Hcp
MAVIDCFLKLEGIEGESKDHKHGGEIDIDVYRWQEFQHGSESEGGGGGAGKVNVHDLSLIMRTSKASPLLMLACCTGQHFPKATLTLRKAGKEQQEYAIWTLTDVLVSRYEISGQVRGDIPRDEVQLNFAKIEYAYKEQKADGSLGPATKTGWDVKANQKV